MKCWRKINLLIVVSVLALIFINYSQAKNDCTTCGSNTVRGASGLTKELEELSKKMEAQGKWPFDLKANSFCYDFLTSKDQTLYWNIDKLTETSYSTYSIKDYLTQPACKPTQIGGGIKSPVIHVAAEDPIGKVNFLEIVKEYIDKRMNDPKLWEEVINAKNTKGQTFLDYTEWIKDLKRFEGDDLKALEKLVSYACKTGGLYSQYKEKKCE